MSYQVGAFCFATAADAGAAACARFEPVTSIVDSGATVRSVSCESFDISTGALNLEITSSPVAGGSSTYSTISQQIAFAPCQESVYLDAAEAISGLVLAAYFSAWGMLKIIQFLGVFRGSAD